MMVKKSVLLTGGCGYIGSHVARQLSEAGHDVIVIDDLSTGDSQALLHGEQLYVGSVGDAATLERVFAEHAIEAVFHFAASIVVPESVTSPLAYYRNNTCNAVALLEACKRHDVSYFVFSSTAAVYGEVAGCPVSESAQLHPASPYGRSKLMTEWILQDYAGTSKLRHAILRYFNVAGADPRGRIGQRSRNATHLIKVACQVATGKRPAMTIFGDDYPTPDGTAVRDYIHVEDLAAAHLAALSYLAGGGSSVTLNCGYGRGFSVREVIDSVRRISGHPLPSHVGPRRPGDVPKIVADPTRILETLDWRPQYADLSAIVESALRWEQRQT
jgi:UDP-glucose 4-epimerase